MSNQFSSQMINSMHLHSHTYGRCHSSTKGFTLVEIAIVMLIITLLLTGLVPTISSQVEQRQSNETRKQMEEIQQALIGYAVAKGYFPCPAVSAASGVEDRTAGVCTGGKRVGLLPWSELGVSKTDSWGRIFRYSVTPAFANSTAPFTLTTLRDITIQTRTSASAALTNFSNASDIPAVVLSNGPNGIFGTLDNGSVIPNTAPGSNNVNDQNTNGTGVGTTFVSRDLAAPTNNSDLAFDDLVVWISPNTLFNRMVQAGKLPQ
jgi:prepilin-type N-terminal cleavage/methylation domain-containing protein